MDKFSDNLDLIGALHQLRVNIDQCISDAQMLRSWTPSQPNPGEKSCAREMSLVITKLEEAKMWAGKSLGQMGSELPKEFQDKAA